MKKIFLAICFSLCACGAFAKGLVFDYFSPSGVTFGANIGGDIFSCAYGVWLDTHDLKINHYSSSYGSYSSYETTTEASSTTNVGPYIQVDWSILPIKFNIASSQMRIGANIGAQVAILYSTALNFDIATGFLLGVQGRYKNFDLTLGWKGTLYWNEMIYSECFYNSCQMGFRYHFGNRNTQKSSSVSVGPSSENSKKTRILPIFGFMRI